MEAKQVRDLMEAYSFIYEKKEAEKESGEKGESGKDEGGKHKEGKHPKGKEEPGEKVTEKEGKEKEEKEMKESVDLFDYILEHLVAEGYADTNKAALAIMANMSGEWKQSIVEKHATFGYNAEDPLDDFEKFVNKGPKTNAQKRKGIELNNKILSKPGMPVKGV